MANEEELWACGQCSSKEVQLSDIQHVLGCMYNFEQLPAHCVIVTTGTQSTPTPFDN